MNRHPRESEADEDEEDALGGVRFLLQFVCVLLKGFFCLGARLVPWSEFPQNEAVDVSVDGVDDH